MALSFAMRSGAADSSALAAPDNTSGRRGGSRYYSLPVIRPQPGDHAMGFIWTIVLGFVIGVLAKLLHPGNENMGLIATVLLGIGGSFVAGAAGQYLGWYQAGEGAGFIASVVAAILLLWVYGKVRGK
jgi:uncharacterized membrane protein YeaQ/YmgE (transglycosylase-associated protein family)